MRPLGALAIYITLVFIFGALMAPWMYWLVQFFFAHSFPDITNAPFHRYVNRSLLLFALIGLWPLLRSLGATSARDVGLITPVGQWKNLGLGVLLGLLSLAIVAGLALGLGARELNPKFAVEKVLEALLGATAVAVLEEILFRGAFFGSLRKAFHWTIALVVSSMIYAIVHYLESAKEVGPITWLSGLELLPGMLRNFTNWQAVIPGFFNLTLAGMLLGLAYQRTGNLYLSIGLHAGWIFWIRCYGMATKPLPDTNEWLWGSGKLAVVNGWVTLPVLVVVVVVVGFMKFKRSNLQPSTVPIQ
jgi:membrane protease YdiL (CAAX protease family)